MPDPPDQLRAGERPGAWSYTGRCSTCEQHVMYAPPECPEPRHHQYARAAKTRLSAARTEAWRRRREQKTQGDVERDNATCRLCRRVVRNIDPRGQCVDWKDCEDARRSTAKPESPVCTLCGDANDRVESGACRDWDACNERRGVARGKG